MRIKVRHLPPRIATGAFILNSGIGKLSAGEEAAAQLHGFAAGAYPFLKKLKPKDFMRLVATADRAGNAVCQGHLDDRHRPWPDDRRPHGQPRQLAGDRAGHRQVPSLRLHLADFHVALDVWQ
jgi:hypothetical protein